MAEEQPGSRILFVDDEPGIRMTLPPILEMHGMKVTSCGSVPEALQAINRDSFDVLLADLNIGQPGDGFTVVSAMRRTQPRAATIILTGYPAFETALEAIRNQVDDYIVKPADVPNLMHVIEQNLQRPRKHVPIHRKRVVEILEEHCGEVVSSWLSATKADPELAGIPLSDKARQNYVPRLLKELIVSLERQPEHLSPKAVEAAMQHGRDRRRQGYTIFQMVEEARYLRHMIGITVQQHLLAIDISNMVTEMIQTGDNFDRALRACMQGFLQD